MNKRHKKRCDAWIPLVMGIMAVLIVMAALTIMGTFNDANAANLGTLNNEIGGLL